MAKSAKALEVRSAPGGPDAREQLSNKSAKPKAASTLDKGWIGVRATARTPSTEYDVGVRRGRPDGGKRPFVGGLTFPGSYITTEYGIGESTRKSGLRDLSSAMVLERDRKPVDDFGGTSHRVRWRYTYDRNELDAPVLKPVGGQPAPRGKETR